MRKKRIRRLAGCNLYYIILTHAWLGRQSQKIKKGRCEGAKKLDLEYLNISVPSVHQVLEGGAEMIDKARLHPDCSVRCVIYQPRRSTKMTLRRMMPR